MGLHTPAHKYNKENKEVLEREKLKSKALDKRKLSVREVQDILERESVGEFEPGQVLTLPINTLR